MNQKLLEKLGMGDKEVKVYLKLLEVGSSGAQNLATRLDENRTSTYSLLLSLQKKGLVSGTSQIDVLEVERRHDRY